MKLSKWKWLNLALLTAGLLQAQLVLAAPAPPFPLANKFSRTVQGLTGVNALTSFVAAKVASIAIGHKLGGQVKVKVRIYSLTDLVAGKVKSIDVTCKDSSLDGVKLGFVHLKTNGPVFVRYRKQKGLKPGLLAPVLLSLDGHLDEKEVSQALESRKVANCLSALKLDLPGLGGQQLEIRQPKVALEQGKVRIDAWLVTLGGERETGVPITIYATPYLDGDAKIAIKNTQIDCPAVEDPKEFSLFFAELLNPLVNFARMDRLDHAFRMQNLTLKQNELDFAGRLILAPKPKAIKPKALKPKEGLATALKVSNKNK